jgi:hypothetical protein
MILLSSAVVTRFLLPPFAHLRWPCKIAGVMGRTIALNSVQIKGRMMAESRDKPDAKRESRGRGARKPAAKAMKSEAESQGGTGETASRLIDERIRELGDWRGETLARLRALIRQADPEVVEEVKWIKPTNPLGVPVWSHAGIICTGEAYKQVVKLTFAKGASLDDPSRLFNSSLEGNTRRAIDFHEGDKLDEKALQALIRAAVALNTSSAAHKPAKRAIDDQEGVGAGDGPP